MEVIQTHVVKTGIALETLQINPVLEQSDYLVLFECERNQWFIRIGSHLEPISPEAAIHIQCAGANKM